MNHVDTVLVAMLKAWPTLRGSRLDCLHDLATGSEYDARWNEDGSLWVSPEKTTGSDVGRWDEATDAEVLRYRDEAGEPDNGVSTTSVRKTVARQALASRLLHMRSEAVKEAFNRDNAEEIIAAGNSYDNDFKDYPNSHGFDNTIPSQRYSLLENVPENADPLWVQAFIELMEEILRFKWPEHKFNGIAPDYAQRYRDDLERAKINAREVLIRLKGTDVEKIELARTKVQARIDALLKEAAQLGVEVEATIK